MNGEPAVWYGPNITEQEMDNIVNETMVIGTMMTELIQETPATDDSEATDDTEGVIFITPNCTELQGDVEQGYWECECPSFNTTGESFIPIPRSCLL